MVESMILILDRAIAGDLSLQEAESLKARLRIRAERGGLDLAVHNAWVSIIDENTTEEK